MNLKEYEEFVIKLMSPLSTKDFQSKLQTSALGLSGESGELTDLVKKIVYHGMDFDENIKQKIISELSDILFYLTFASREICEMGLQDILDFNVEKLSKRYSNKTFSKEEFIKKENESNRSSTSNH